MQSSNIKRWRRKSDLFGAVGVTQGVKRLAGAFQGSHVGNSFWLHNRVSGRSVSVGAGTGGVRNTEKSEVV